MKRREFLAAAGLASAAALPGISLASDMTTQSMSYTPGHWVSLFPKQDSQTIMADKLRLAPQIKGFHKRWYWSHLEAGATATTARYTLDEIQSDLDWCWARGLKLMIMIQDKTFVMENPLPQYLAHKAVPNRGRGYTAIRWDPLVASRMSRLMNAIGSRFRNHGAFEGLGAEETSPGLTTEQLAATRYTSTKYLDTYVQQTRSFAAVAPNLRHFWHFNFVPGSKDPAEYVVSRTLGCPLVVGGPDADPTNEALSQTVYPQYQEIAGRVPTSIVFSATSYAQQKPDGTYMTMQQVFDFARTQLRISYAFWTPMGNPWDGPEHRFADACVVISNTQNWVGA
jgi:hypothetical protein